MDILTKNEDRLDPSIKYIALPEEDYINLLANSLRFEALEDSGVDNWSYYSDAFYDYKLEYANWYGDKFIDWIKERKDPDMTIDQYLKYNLTFEDLARFETEMNGK